MNAVKAYISPINAALSRWRATMDEPFRTPEREATRILSNVEPYSQDSGDTTWQFLECMATWERDAIVSSLSALAADGGPLDELAHDCAPEVYRAEGFAMLDMMIRNERVQA